MNTPQENIEIGDTYIVIKKSDIRTLDVTTQRRILGRTGEEFITSAEHMMEHLNKKHFIIPSDDPHLTQVINFYFRLTIGSQKMDTIVRAMNEARSKDKGNGLQ